MRIALRIAALGACAGAAFAALCAACSSASVTAPAPAPANWRSLASSWLPDAGGGDGAAGTARSVAKAYTAALDDPEFAGLAALFEEQAHFAFPGMPDALGRDPVVHAHEVLFGSFDRRGFVTSRLWQTRKAQIVEWTMTGTQAKDWQWVAASQRPVVIRGLTLLWTNDDGTIADCHVYFDVAAVKAQLGAGPKALAGLPVPSVPPDETQVIAPTGQQNDNAAVVGAALDALESVDEPAYLALFTDDIEISTLETAKPARGKGEAVRAYFKTIHKALGQLDTTVTSSWNVGPYAIVEYRIDGEQLGPVAWVPLQVAAQREPRVVRLDVADVAEVRGGRIARVWRYDNPGQVAKPGP